MLIAAHHAALWSWTFSSIHRYQSLVLCSSIVVDLVLLINISFGLEQKRMNLSFLVSLAISYQNCISDLSKRLPFAIHVFKNVSCLWRTSSHNKKLSIKGLTSNLIIFLLKNEDGLHSKLNCNQIIFYITPNAEYA